MTASSKNPDDKKIEKDTSYQAARQQDMPPSENRNERTPRNRDGDNKRSRPLGTSSEKMPGAVNALIELDKDLMKLLVRRAKLVSRIRQGHEHAGNPVTIQAEKSVRTSFEANALSFSKDPKFTRQLFNLLQDLKVLTREEAENKPGFLLSPPHKKIKGAVTGPASGLISQIWIFLASCLGKDLILDSVPWNESVSTCCKALNQAGGVLARQQERGRPATLSVVKEAKPSFAGKSIFLGDDEMTLYMISFLSTTGTGIIRFSGGPALKETDLSGLRNILPSLGARLAHTIPNSKGLPATLECSGIIPATITLPENLPLPGVLAALATPLFLQKPISIELSELPAEIAATALTEMRIIFSSCNADVEVKGSKLVYSGSPINFPARLTPPLEPELSAYLLALPAFTGGSLTLNGNWLSHLPGSQEVEQVLAWAGVKLEISPDSVTATADDASIKPLLPDELSERLFPLVCALSALNFKTKKKSGELPFTSSSFSLAQEFLSCLGITIDKEGVWEVDQTASAATWVCPDALWGMALALGSFVRPGVRLANPDTVVALMPSFWPIFNSLPEPHDPESISSKAKEEEAEPKRRRIITS